MIKVCVTLVGSKLLVRTIMKVVTPCNVEIVSLC